MLGRQRLRRLTILLALIAALSGACKASDPRTQVMLVIDAEPEVRARATELHVTFQSYSEFDFPDGVEYTETFPTVEGSSPYWPYSIALTPRGNDARRSYKITATLYEGETLIAELRARSGFIPQRTLELRLLFSAACLDERSLDCGDEETCYDGECWSAEIDPLSLPALGGAPLMPDGDGGLSSGVHTGTQRGADGGTSGTGGRRGSGGTPGAGAADGGMADAPPRASGGDCGDGVWNDDEQCDTAIPPGMPGACRTECPEAPGCKPLRLEGSGCQTHCEEYPVQSAIPEDGCCLEGSNADEDPDCDSRCGNSILEMGEECDGDCPTDPSQCPAANGCQMAVIEGDAQTCTAHCVMRELDVCVSGDGCCPSGCTYATDMDCSPNCGNGIVEPELGEICEPNGDPACPASCDDGDPCTDDIATGSAEQCNLRCDHTPKTRTISGDMCCPPGRGNANNDSDCMPMCGNRVIERGEFCDGNCPTQESQCEDFIPCTRGRLVAGPCGMRCTFEPILTAANNDQCCPLGANANNDNDCAPSCGNGVVENGELCDGNCPPSCPPDTDNNSCTANMVVGTGCQRRCQTTRLTANLNGRDGCCPQGANHTTDSDCVPVCLAGQKLCGGTCTNTQTNLDHCGDCNKPCGANESCVAGTCQISCTGGAIECDGKCVMPNTDEHCIGCMPCPLGQTCMGGQCQVSCTGGAIECDGECVMPNTNDHCIGCMPCPLGQTCMGGQCQVSCTGGAIECDGKCVMPNTNDHCIGCMPCPLGQTCMGGQCQVSCTGGAIECGGKCVMPNTDEHCIGCMPCPLGQTCTGGQCQVSCTGATIECDGICVTPNTDDHCIGCTPCPQGQTCMGGQCQAPEEPDPNSPSEPAPP